jgi:pyruvate,water dikinase
MPAYYDLNEFELQDEDLKNYRVWIGDFVHSWPPYSPLFAWARNGHHQFAFSYSAETLSLPGTKGWQWRIVDGLSYLGIIEPKSEEIPEREKLFRERITPYIENWDEIWGKTIEEWKAILKPFKEFDVGRASNAELYSHWEDFLWLDFQMWKRHFIWMYPAYILFNLFEDLCGELLGITSVDPLFKRVLAGFDNTVLRFDRALWRLGDRAKELGLDNIFTTVEDNEEVMSKLEQTDAGRKWLDEYREFLNVYGWRCPRVEEWWDNPSWIEKPSLGIPIVRQAIIRGGAFTVDAEFERLKAERVEAEKELLAKVPAEQREWFEKLMRCAQRSGVFSEDHNTWFDMHIMSIGRHLTREMGKRFVQAGALDDPEHIYFLHPDEIRKAAIAMEKANLRPYAQKRYDQWAAAWKLEPKPFIGDISVVPELSMRDPIIRVIAAIPVVKPELKADLYGAASAPGVAEGIARVIPDEKSMGEVRAGEILVAPMTMSTWTPLFSIVAAVVTDGGGTLSHAVIVGREYGLPVVAGTVEATKKIKTGQRIKVDGTNGAVYILD